MSDERLREAERRWRETRSVDDEAIYLRERVRAGRLTPERLALAAYCGHAAAQLCVESPSIHGLSAWAREIGSWGLVPVVVAGLECAEIALGMWRREFPGSVAADELVGLVREWTESSGAAPTSVGEPLQRAIEQEIGQRLRHTPDGRFVHLSNVLVGPAQMIAQGSATDAANRLADMATVSITIGPDRGGAVRARLGRAVATWALAP